MRSQETYNFEKLIERRDNRSDPTTQAQCALTGKETGMSKKKAYFDAQDFVNRKLEEATNRALKEKNAQFAIDHIHDTDAQLLDYLRQCAMAIGHLPKSDEIIGGGYLCYRFGGWGRVLAAANLDLPRKKVPANGRKIYRDELKVQAALYRQAKRNRQQPGTQTSCSPE